MTKNAKKFMENVLFFFAKEYNKLAKKKGVDWKVFLPLLKKAHTKFTKDDPNTKYNLNKSDFDDIAKELHSAAAKISSAAIRSFKLMYNEEDLSYVVKAAVEEVLDKDSGE